MATQETWYTATTSTFAKDLYQFTDSLNNLRSLHAGTTDPENTSGTAKRMLWAHEYADSTSPTMDIRNGTDDGWYLGPEIDKDGWGLIHYRDRITNTNTPSGATSVALPITDGSTTYYVPAYAAEW